MKPVRGILSAWPVRAALSVVLSGALAALLVAAIHWTQFDLMWIAFLGGVLFAAVVAMASRASRAEWIIARRGKQLERLRAQLAEETRRSRNTGEALRIADARLRMLTDALPTIIVYVDRDERCRQHNRALREKTGLPAEKIDGQALRDIVGNDVYLNMGPHIASALSGELVDYELVWDTPDAADPVYSVRHVPYPPNDPQPHGFYLMLTKAVQPIGAGTPATLPVSEQSGFTVEDVPTLSGAGGETLYFRAITDELLGWGDPRAKLMHAVAENQFLLFAQKIQPLKDGVPECYEVLLRLREEEDNLLPPGGFIPVAERYGMMEELDRWVIRNLMASSLERQQGDAGWRIPIYCVNVSGAAVSSPRFAEFVRTELSRTSYPAGSLCFEIGEQDIFNHRAGVHDFITTLGPAGCRFTVDSFGSAKVAFSHLKGLRFHFIKIDGVIIQNILRDPSALAKTKAIHAVCRKAGVRTIAEFVETAETLDKLHEVRIDYAQGFGIALPGPIHEVQ